MTDRTIVGVFATRTDAESAIAALRDAGVGNDDISVVTTNSRGDVTTKDGAGDAAKDTAGGALSGATTGGILGAIAGLVVANGILPGLGTLFVAGPLAAALGLTGAAATTAAGALTGAAAGGLIGALGGLGVGEDDARKYEERVKSGDYLLTVHSDHEGVAGILESHNAQDVREYMRQ
jgi:hypothetical protein